MDKLREDSSATMRAPVSPILSTSQSLQSDDEVTDIMRSIDHFLDSYFSALNQKISQTKLYTEDDNLPSKIKEFYVSLPINLVLDIRVNNAQVSHIRIAGNEEWESADNTLLSSLVPKINKLVEENIEYRYQNRSERPRILAPTYINGDKNAYWTCNGIDAIAIFDALVIIGDPGQGKSTLFKFLATKLIEQYSSSNSVFNGYSISDLFDCSKYIPVFIELKDFVSWLSNKENVVIDDEVFFDYICETLLREYDSLTYSNRKIFTEKCIYILDGLDEIEANTFNKSLINRLIHTILSYPEKSCKLIMSCRERDYSLWNLSRLKVFRIELMDMFTANQLVQRIFDLQYAVKETSELFSILHNLGIDITLYGNPLFLSLIAQLFLEDPNNFPKTKSIILCESIRLLLKRKPHTLLKNKSWDINQVFGTLEEIAYKIQITSSSDSCFRISDQDIAGIICVNHEWCSWGDFKDFLASTTGIISNVGDRVYEFTHRHFQEYLCASYLLNQKDPNTSMEIIKNGLITNKRIWGEVSLLYIELLHDGRRMVEIWNLLNSLSLYTSSAKENAPWVAWYIGKIIECRNYAIYRQHTKDDPSKQLTIDQVQKVLLRTFLDMDSLPLKERVFCGKVLGVIGDPRKGIGVDESGIPDILWCQFDAMQYKMGVDEDYKTRVRNQIYQDIDWGKRVEFIREEPQVEIMIPEFEISKYPITVAQFNAFVNDDEGYFAIENWKWSSVSENWFIEHVEGKKISDIQNRGKVNPSNFPVTDVSWIEAVAFCEWLSKKSGLTIRLPTEGEWEAVAKHDKTIFTWGDEFDELKCNSSLSKIGDIAPAGTFSMYTKKDYPCELNGNVWEWCDSIFPAWDSTIENLSVYDEQKNYIGNYNRQYLGIDTQVAVRGGSYINPPVFLRSNFRGRDQISLAFYRQGFRIVNEVTKRKTHFNEINLLEKMGHDQNYFKAGSGASVRCGDKVRISYLVKQGERVIEDMTSPELNFEIVLGSGQIHKAIDDFILSHDPRISTSFEQEFEIALGQLKDDVDKYTFYILIQDKR